MSVHGAPADGGAGSPHLAQELHAGCDRTTAPHKCEEEAELRTRDSHRLSSAQDRLRRRLQEDAPEANRSSESGRSTRGQTASSSKQLFHPGDQLAYDGSVRVSGTIQFVEADDVCFGGLDWKRGGYLKLMDDRACLCGRFERFNRTRLRRGSRGIRFVSCLILIVDDEDSRNASIVNAQPKAQGAGASCMSEPTPADAGLLDGHDRRRWWAEEQIGSGLLLPYLEALDRWYEAEFGEIGGDLFVTRRCFKNERQPGGAPPCVSAFNDSRRRAITSALRSKCEPCQAGTPARRMMAWGDA